MKIMKLYFICPKQYSAIIFIYRNIILHVANPTEPQQRLSTNLGKQTVISRKPQIILGVTIIGKQTHLLHHAVSRAFRI